MEEYVKVDIKEYVNELLKNNSVIEAYKFARIIAKQGSNKEEVISWSTDKDGYEVLEKEILLNLMKKEICLGLL